VVAPALGGVVAAAAGVTLDGDDAMEAGSADVACLDTDGDFVAAPGSACRSGEGTIGSGDVGRPAAFDASTGVDVCEAVDVVIDWTDGDPDSFATAGVDVLEARRAVLVCCNAGGEAFAEAAMVCFPPRPPVPVGVPPRLLSGGVRTVLSAAVVGFSPCECAAVADDPCVPGFDISGPFGDADELCDPVLELSGAFVDADELGAPGLETSDPGAEVEVLCVLTLDAIDGSAPPTLGEFEGADGVAELADADVPAFAPAPDALGRMIGPDDDGPPPPGLAGLLGGVGPSAPPLPGVESVVFDLNPPDPPCPLEPMALPMPFPASCTPPAAAIPPTAALAPMLRATPSPAIAPSIIGITRMSPNGINAASSKIADPWIMATFPPSVVAPDINEAPVANVTAMASFEKINATAVSVALRA
jgi:hypothetical protein